MEHIFQVNLQGIIELLSKHLYSGPHVYIRELLQNAVDAISARSAVETVSGEINLILSDVAQGPKLTITDNGIGLTEAEVHQFLSVIGESSKRQDWQLQRGDFIGQFGIGLLACFLVADEIEVITCSAKNDAVVRWRGLPNGKYYIENLNEQRAVGTTVTLFAKQDAHEYFTLEFIEKNIRHYGGMLPFPIYVNSGDSCRQMNDEPPPWLRSYDSDESRRRACLQYGRDLFDMDFVDAIELGDGDTTQGIAFVLPYSPGLNSKTKHRVYLKRMLVSEDADNVMPDWAFFVKCVINTSILRPTASRESFYEDDRLQETRKALGTNLSDYLVALEKQHPDRLQEIISLHRLAIKALSLADNDLYRIFIHHLPFETTMGTITLGEYLRHSEKILYVANIDQYRQLAPVATAQNIWIINAGYVYDADLLQHYLLISTGVEIEMVDPVSLIQDFAELGLAEREGAQDFLQRCARILAEYDCQVLIRKFEPASLPVLYTLDSNMEFLRSAKQSRDVADELWAGILDDISISAARDAFSGLCFNYLNPLIKKLVLIEDETLFSLSIKMLYVQALLLGHHPLHSRELAVLGNGLLGFIDWGISLHKGDTIWGNMNPGSLN